MSIDTPLRANRWLLLATLSAGALLVGCGGGDDSGARISSVRITNNGPSQVAFNAVINGNSFYRDDDDILDEVRRTRAATSVDERFHIRLWRYVMENRYHDAPYTVHLWGHSPVLMFNSIGFGFCDDAASVYAALAEKSGYESRVWVLSGHVVPEVRVEGRWEMLDPDLQVFYLNAIRQIAGVEELAANPQWITDPIGSASADSWVHSPALSEIYSSTGDNYVEPWLQHQLPIPAYSEPFILPSGAYLDFPVLDEVVLKSHDDVVLTNFEIMKMVLPKTWIGQIHLPFVIIDIRGTGRLSLQGTQVAMGSNEASRLLNDRSRHVNQVAVESSGSEVEIFFLVNKKRFNLSNITSFELKGSNVSRLSVVQR